MVYCPLVNLSVTNDADQDIFQLTAGSANKIKLHGFELYSAAIAAEAVRLRLVRRTTDGNGSAATAVKPDEDDGTITGAVETLATTPGTAGDVLAEYVWEQLGPLVHLPTPEMRIMIQEGGRIGLNLLTALGATTVMAGSVVWEEI
jgi:hypothetical protein